MSEKKAIISLGGSIVVPLKIDTGFLGEFSLFIRKFVEGGYRFFIIVGGGSVCRQYQSAAAKINSNLTPEDLDFLGIETTKLNAFLIKTILGDISEEKLIDYESFTAGSKPVAVGGGWKPGCSSDVEAVVLAEKINVNQIINLTNIDYVYRADPKKDPNTKPLKEVSWGEYRAMVGDKWSPGMSVPFDPVASKKAQELGLTVKIVNGKNLENLEKCLNCEEFQGTTIR